MNDIEGWIFVDKMATKSAAPVSHIELAARERVLTEHPDRRIRKVESSISDGFVHVTVISEPAT